MQAACTNKYMCYQCVQFTHLFLFFSHAGTNLSQTALINDRWGQPAVPVLTPATKVLEIQAEAINHIHPDVCERR